MESEPILTPAEKPPLPEAQRRFEPKTLHHAGQQAQHPTNWAILDLKAGFGPPVSWPQGERLITKPPRGGQG